MDEDAKDLPQQQKWQTWAVVGGLVFTVAVFFYGQTQSQGANAVTLQNHTTEIAALQAAMNNQQVELSAISAQDAAIIQQLHDMQLK